MRSSQQKLERSLLLGSVEEALGRIAKRKLYLESPERFVYDVIGRDVLAKSAGRDIVLTDKQIAFLRAFVDRNVSSIIIKCGRGNSKTFLFALGIALLSYVDPSFTCTVLAGSFEQAQYLYHYFSIFAESDEFSRVISGKVERTRTKLVGGGWVYVLTASEKQVKGPHPAMLVFDEMCAAEEKIVELAEGQLLGSRADKPLYRVASTPDKLFHTFRDYWNNADEYGFVQFHWRAYDCPWISIETIELLKKRHDSNWIRIHIDGEFGSATGTVFDFDDVEATRIDSLQEDELFDEANISATTIGVDWGFVHPTVFVVASVLDLVVRELDSIPLEAKLFYVRHVEAHTGKPDGDDDVGYEQFLYGRAKTLVERYAGDFFLDSSHIFQNETVKKIASDAGRTAESIPFSRDKMTMVGWANTLLEKKLVRIPKEYRRLLEQLSNYSWEEKQEKPIKKDDDYVDAFNLALWGFNRPQYGVVEVDDEIFR